MNKYQDFCHAITTKLFNLIEQQGSLLTWHKCWENRVCLQLPVGANGIYHGGNLFSLLYEQYDGGPNSNHWLTFKQVNKKGGHVKKGAKSNVVYFWQMRTVADKENKDGGVKQAPFFKTYSVFNLEQTTLGMGECIAPEVRTSSVDELISKAGVAVSHFGGRPFYQAVDGAIVLPGPENFNTKENYFAMLLHEFVHATGAKEGRVPRPCFDNYALDEKARAEEELIAEIGPVFLCVHLGIKGELEEHASYIKNWKQLLNEKEAMGAANKAAKVFALPIS